MSNSRKFGKTASKCFGTYNYHNRPITSGGLTRLGLKCNFEKHAGSCSIMTSSSVLLPVAAAMTRSDACLRPVVAPVERMCEDVRRCVRM